MSLFSSHLHSSRLFKSIMLAMFHLFFFLITLFLILFCLLFLIYFALVLLQQQLLNLLHGPLSLLTASLYYVYSLLSVCIFSIYSVLPKSICHGKTKHYNVTVLLSKFFFIHKLIHFP